MSVSLINIFRNLFLLIVILFSVVFSCCIKISSWKTLSNQPLGKKSLLKLLSTAPHPQPSALLINFSSSPPVFAKALPSHLIYYCFQLAKGECREDGDRLISAVHSRTMRNNGHWLEQKKFELHKESILKYV